MSKTQKRLTGLAAALIILLSLSIAYLLQPSGQLRNFQQWQSQPISGAAHDSKLTVNFFGVSTLLFDDGQEQILIDGFFSRPSLSQVLLQPIQSNSELIEQMIREQQLQRAKALLVTHSHYDHALDVAALGQRLPKLQIIGSGSTLNIARGGHVPEQQLVPVQPWKTLQIGHFSITAIPSQHTPPTAVNNDLGQEIAHPLPLPARFSEFKEGHSFDYLIEHHGCRILVKASTGAIAHQFKNIRADVLFLGIAQLSRQTPGYQQRYLMHTLGTLKPKIVVPIHWDDFFQPLHQPLQFLPRAADNTARSMQILIDAAAKQKTQVVLLSQPVSYSLP